MHTGIPSATIRARRPDRERPGVTSSAVRAVSQPEPMLPGSTNVMLSGQSRSLYASERDDPEKEQDARMPGRASVTYDGRFSRPASGPAERLDEVNKLDALRQHLAHAENQLRLAREQLRERLSELNAPNAGTSHSSALQKVRSAQIEHVAAQNAVLSLYDQLYKRSDLLLVKQPSP